MKKYVLVRKNRKSGRCQRQSGAAETRAAGVTARCCDVGLILRHTSNRNGRFEFESNLEASQVPKNTESFILSKLLHWFQLNFAKRQRPPSGHRGWTQTRQTNWKITVFVKFVKAVHIPADSKATVPVMANIEEIITERRLRWLGHVIWI